MIGSMRDVGMSNVVAPSARSPPRMRRRTDDEPVNTIRLPTNGPPGSTVHSSRREPAATLPIMSVAGDESSASFARPTMSPSVPSIVLCECVVADSTHAIGVSASRPASKRTSTTRGNAVTPMSTTIVSE